VAPLGTAFTVDQAKLLKRFCGTVVLLFDGDAAGGKATLLAEEPCTQASLEAEVVVLPPGSDPDDLVRTKGANALKDVLAHRKGIGEYAIDAIFDGEFAQTNARERLALFELAKQVLARQRNPVHRLMLKTYADRWASRLDLHGLSPGRDRSQSEIIGALERQLRSAVAAEVPPTPENADPRRARVQPKPPGSAERGEIVGALIEYPELLEDEEIGPALNLLEGASAHTVAAIRKSLRSVASSQTSGTIDSDAHDGNQKRLDATVFLAQIPQAIQAFASERLAAPRHDTLKDARASVIENATKLRKLILGREADDIAREQYKAAGDWQVETELAREAMDRVRLRHGVKKESGD
jgi:DNA primase